MSEEAGGSTTPYTSYPGGSMPPAATSPEEGTRDLWGYFWLALLNTAIIAITGIVVWWFVH